MSEHDLPRITTARAAEYIADLATELAEIADRAELLDLAAELRKTADRAKETLEQARGGTVMPFKRSP